MRFDSLTAFLAVSNVLLGVSAGPLAAKRQDGSTSSSSSSAATAGLVADKSTTFEAQVPTPTSSGASKSGTASAEGSGTAAASSSDASETTSAATATGTGPPISTAFPVCHDTSADSKNPFCLPNNGSTLYTDKTYYATWNADSFPANSTITVKAQFINDSLQEVWSSAETQNSWGFVTVPTSKDWLQGQTSYNLTFYAIMFEGDDVTKKANPYEGPTIMITNEPAQHYQPPDPTKVPNKEGLMIGLPVSLGFVLLVVVGLYFGMRKHRHIGLGSIMGRRSKGYGTGKSKRQRMGLGKKGAIRLEDRENAAAQARSAPAHAHGDSLGSLVSDDEIRPAPGGNQFRDEIRRQQTGR
ncbi:hypothetical protein K491DRAFT_719361 [Lophiostoma macrostomum CBS 122681]|uniref:Uncharacterized protein n=1 Tax=Lophiostoma macrostomum CBS 122681 TaxID=1314788 RepID=A0A6A6SZJ8_9PLEO|nr:hypothetical protein K491DRAFT_719361 [Lophiostoma macrostomum CBS 122681]